MNYKKTKIEDALEVILNSNEAKMKKESKDYASANLIQEFFHLSKIDKNL